MSSPMTTTERGGDWRHGDWMQTFTGRQFWPLDPRPDDIDPRDIAHALSLLCRYGGHTKRFYSVAEHCVLLSHAVAPEYSLWALLHDAAEAYIVDVPRPVKRHLDGYKAIEDGLLAVIAERFGLPPFRELPPPVIAADNRILLDERAVLLTRPPTAWHQDIEQLQPLGVHIDCWVPDVAEAAYLRRLEHLIWESRP